MHLRMFHTPPGVNPVFEQESRKNSYQVEDQVDENTIVKQNERKSSLVSNFEELQSGTIKLPDDLNKELDSFIKFLKLPKFNRPLNLDDISKLYQQFYNEFNDKNIRYWEKEYGLEERNQDELLTKEEMLERNQLIEKVNNSVYLSDLLIEKLVCNKFYGKIFKSDKLLMRDELNRLINDKLNLKLKKLNKLDVTLQNLDLDLNVSNVNELIDLLIPLYQEMFKINSPTLKLLKFKKVHELINHFLKRLNISINGDYYLPILIFSLIQISDKVDFDLVLELNFIKNFKNNVIYEQSNSNETGELLYILTNLDACLIYLLNVTTGDLKIESDDQLLSSPLTIDESSLTYCEDFNVSKKGNKSNALDYYSTRLQEYAFYNADHGIRTIGNAFDSSVKTIFGRFLPTTNSEIDKETLSQIEENFNNKIEQELISPISTSSTLNTSNSSSSNGVTITTTATAPAHQRSESDDNRNSHLKSLSHSMSGVMRNLRPMSNSNSSTSLNSHLTETSPAPEKSRSRATSLIGEVFSQPVRSSSSGFINTIEHAFENRKSRGNSLLGGTTNNLIGELRKEHLKNSKKFEEMSVSELKKMYENYNKIMSSSSPMS